MRSGSKLQVHNGTSVKTVILEDVRHQYAMVHWPGAGQYEIDLITGELLSRVQPPAGVYDVDRDTGRVRGTRLSVKHEDMPQLDEALPGDLLQLVHDGGFELLVQVVDALASEGTLRVFIQTSPYAKTVDRTYRTGWSVDQTTLQALHGNRPRLVSAATG